MTIVTYYNNLGDMMALLGLLSKFLVHNLDHPLSGKAIFVLKLLLWSDVT
jgi:hypothetical protein